MLALIFTLLGTEYVAGGRSLAYSPHYKGIEKLLAKLDALPEMGDCSEKEKRCKKYGTRQARGIVVENEGTAHYCD